MSREQRAVQERVRDAPLEGQEDDVLARQAPRNPDAFGELYRRYAARIYRYHLVRTSSVDEAQDLTSLTFLAALESMHRYRGQAGFGGWLFGIARHKLADHYRRGRDAASLDGAAEADPLATSIEDTAADRLQVDQVAAAMRALEPQQAEALALRVFGELSAAEAGQVMGKSETAVRMLVYRGVRRLRETLGCSVEVTL